MYPFAALFRVFASLTVILRRKAVVVSIDSDVLKKSILRAVCPQGVMEVDELINHLRKVRENGPINAILICGLTEEKESQDDWSLYALSRILAEANALLREVQQE